MITKAETVYKVRFMVSNGADNLRWRKGKQNVVGVVDCSGKSANINLGAS